MGPAVLAGDGLLALARVTLGRAAGGEAAAEHLSQSLIDLVHGQAQDIAFESRPWTGPDAVTVEEYLTMVEKFARRRPVATSTRSCGSSRRPTPPRPRRRYSAVSCSTAATEGNPVAAYAPCDTYMTPGFTSR